MSNTRSGPRWKNNLRYLVATLSAAGAAYAVDRWFLSGVMASKWIGLPQYASAMSQLQMESRHWGIAALVAEGTGGPVGATALGQGETNTNRDFSPNRAARGELASGIFLEMYPPRGILPGWNTA